MTVIQPVCLNFLFANKELPSLFFKNATRGARFQIRTQNLEAGLTRVCLAGKIRNFPSVADHHAMRPLPIPLQLAAGQRENRLAIRGSP
ncbi:hypothetical protein [Rhizobium leguminosarum]|uniref:hypothetical protein n=1 Tax=Rhizobium TaxID=379 RepID=UPI0013DC8413|nr:hypothetical protein [Rhizobium leguminosarum]MBB4509575.1 hypothetical protein [Rhizobium leguminosarum]